MPRYFGKTPSWSLRYMWVEHFLKAHEDIETVTDIGSGNGKVSAWYKSVAHIGTVNFLEKNWSELVNPHNHYRPGIVETMLGRRDIDKPVHLNCFFGDALVPDERLVADCIVMIEVIEHLVPEDVEAITKVIFGFYQPKYVIITTPNREFNNLLKDYEPTKFRHPDHKFEWDRAEFANYCQQVCHVYPYQFFTDGVGEYENSDLHGVGKSTQIAAFMRNTPDFQVVRKIEDWISIDMLFDRIQIKDFSVSKSPKSIRLVERITLDGDKRSPELKIQVPWEEISMY